jgi:two-component system NtrC family sensor kinase
MDKMPVENESQRLAALLNYHITAPDSEIDFQDLTTLAASICNTPMASVTLLDKDKVYFKSNVGFDLDEADRDDIFCKHAIHQTDVFVIEDTLRVFGHNTFVVHPPHVRFYAGAPLVDDEGFALGTLCVMDIVPRKLTQQQCLALKTLSKQAISLINLKKSRDEMHQHFSELQKLTHYISVQQEQMVSTARMTSLGEMANGVAHEINNPLSVIDHTVEKISRTHKMDMKSMMIIQKSIHRITSIIHGLRNYGRDGDKDPKEILNMKSLLHTTLELYSTRAKEEGIVLILDSKDAHEVEAIHTHISQILMNLMQNSFFAIHQSERKWISLKSYSDGTDVVIEVADSGPGIDKALRNVIFDPFFTTKESGEGTGLGLSVSKKLAEKNGGSLSLDPTSAETKFVLRLKQFKKSSPEQPKVSPSRLPLAS